MRCPRDNHAFRLRSDLWSINPAGAKEIMLAPPLQHHRMDRSTPETAWRLLEQQGHSSPEEAWLAWKDRPTRPALAIDAAPPDNCPLAPENAAHWLHCALILGKCRRNLFDPDAPVIWTMNRLTRGVRLVSLEPEILD